MDIAYLITANNDAARKVVKRLLMAEPGEVLVLSPEEMEAARNDVIAMPRASASPNMFELVKQVRMADGSAPGGS